MATGKGVIQGYTGVAAVDSACQIIVEAHAHGSGSEQELVLLVVEGFRDLIQTDSLLTADAGYHSEENLKQPAERGIDALIADNGMHQRDERFAEQSKHKTKPDPLWDKTPKENSHRLFAPQDFVCDEESKTCICPAGEFLYQNGSQVVKQGREAVKFTEAKRVCEPCTLRELKCPTPNITGRRRWAKPAVVRQVLMACRSRNWRATRRCTGPTSSSHCGRPS